MQPLELLVGSCRHDGKGPKWFFLSFKDRAIIEACKEHNSTILVLREPRETLFAFLQPLIITVISTCKHLVKINTQYPNKPLSKDYTTLFPLDRTPHTATSDEIFAAGIDSVECLVLMLAPVRY